MSARTTARPLRPLRHRVRNGSAAALAGLMLIALGACGTADGAAAPSASDRVVSTVDGKVTVPASPHRIVAGTAWAVNTLLDLGITPVGAFNGAANVVLPRYRATMASVTNISASDGYSDDLEKIAALHPDLIFTFATSPTRKKETRLAATIGQDSVHESWQQLTAQVAEAG